MTDAQRKAVDRMLEEGKPVVQGTIPSLDPVSGFYANLWTELRASTPGDQPISIEAISLVLGREGMLHALPYMQTMDRALFELQSKRLKEERRKRESKAKAKRGPGIRRRH